MLKRQTFLQQKFSVSSSRNIHICIFLCIRTFLLLLISLRFDIIINSTWYSMCFCINRSSSDSHAQSEVMCSFYEWLFIFHVLSAYRKIFSKLRYMENSIICIWICSQHTLLNSNENNLDWKFLIYLNKKNVIANVLHQLKEMEKLLLFLLCSLKCFVLLMMILHFVLKRNFRL